MLSYFLDLSPLRHHLSTEVNGSTSGNFHRSENPRSSESQLQVRIITNQPKMKSRPFLEGFCVKHLMIVTKPREIFIDDQTCMCGVVQK